MFTEKHILGNPFNGHRLVRYITVIDPIPPGAIRVRTTDGLPPNKTPYTTYKSAVKVDGYDDVYDVWNEYNGKYSWSYILTQCNNLYEVLDSNPSGVTATAQLLFNKSTLQKISDFHPCSSNIYGLFCDCSALTAIPTFDTTDVRSVNSWFYNCSSVQSGALEMYNQLTAQGTVTSHNDTFYGCGSANSSGMADLRQIPEDWGGKAISFKTVTIGNQIWMAENLAVNDGGTGIYSKQVSANGVDFGTQYYYTTAAANRVANTINGWHLPNESEWNTLFNAIGGSDSAGKMLKSTAGWNNNGNGTDNYDFTVLPCGISNGTATYSIGYNADFDISGKNNQTVEFHYMYDSVNWPVATSTYYRSVRLVHD